MKYLTCFDVTAESRKISPSQFGLSDRGLRKIHARVVTVGYSTDELHVIINLKKDI